MRRGGLGLTLRRSAFAIAVAGLVHLTLWAILAWLSFDHTSTITASRSEPPVIDIEPARSATDHLVIVQLADEQMNGIPEIPLAALLGPADEVGHAQTHPAPHQPVDLPGEQAARRGGGAIAGETASTQRADQTTDVPIRHELWNGKTQYQSGHDRTGRTHASPEAVRRDDRRDVGDRATAARVASAGDASNGRSTEQHGAGTATAPAPAPPHDATAGTVSPAPSDGALRPNPTPPLVEPGAKSVDTPVRGERPTDDTNAAAASRDTKPGPFEITPPAAGGTARSGVSGPTPAPGSLGTSAGAGTGATRLDVRRGARDVTVEADAQDPYFRLLFARLEKAIVFPHQLALELRSGRPIGELVLHADGAIGGTRISLSSGFAGFDRELLRALATLKRLPPPPAKLLDGRSEIRVRVEWVFDPAILR